MVPIKLLFFVFIPLDINNQSRYSQKMVFSFDKKTFYKSLQYLVLLIGIHQLIYLISYGTLYGFSNLTLRSHCVSFIASTTITILAEEILYRGFLFHLLVERLVSIKKAAIIVAILFGIAHYQFGIMFILYAIITSLIFTKLYLNTGSIIYPVLIHGLLNIYL
ncbi:MAG: CPBP family intramembrane metalloprotease [Firmicutes bacterium]|nr:CPBP family intramembrane metalloprotease [Bacillota bacterium]